MYMDRGIPLLGETERIYLFTYIKFHKSRFIMSTC